MTNGTKPSIAILHYAAPPTIGGVEATMAMHARLFANHGYTVKIIAGRGEQFDPRIPVEIIPTIDSRHAFVTEVSHKLANGILTSDFRALTAAIYHTLQKALAEVDICIVHNALTLHKNLGLTNALCEIVQAHHVRLIAWAHDIAWGDAVYADELHVGTPWDLLRQPWSGVRYVVVSEARKTELQALWRTKRVNIAVVPPGADVFEFLGIGDTAVHLARELNWLDAAPLLLVPARVTRRKNIQLAIEITAALRRHGLDPKLVVMGPLGPHNPANVAYLTELRALRRKCGVEDAVIFLQEYGTVDNVMRRDLYLLADALLFPSEREGFGIPILEAGLARLPIFCTDIPPFRESAREYAHYFALNESPQTIAERVAGCLAQDARYQLKQRVLREYAWERIFTERIEPLVCRAEAPSPRSF